MLDDGASLAETASAPVREAIKAAGDIALKPVPAAVFRINDQDQRWVDAMRTPHPIATLTDKASVTAARERIARKSYIRAKG